MGDASDMADIERFMRSPEGEAHLKEVREMLQGHTIREVSFENDVHFITTTLHLDDGGAFVVFQPSMEIGAIRGEFEDVLEREYYVDYPERRPEEGP